MNMSNHFNHKSTKLKYIFEFYYIFFRSQIKESMKRMLEVAADSVVSALNAEKGGAKRLELCENLAQGGVTPSWGKMVLSKEKVSIPVYVLIRPRKGDFLYSSEEIEVMLHDIKICRDLGMDGVVCGALKKDGQVDLDLTSRFLEAGKGMDFTFHRAFDLCKNPFEAIDQLIEIGVSRILTSGQCETAPIGATAIAEFIRQSGGKISFMAGGGVRPESVEPLLGIEGLHEFHTSGSMEVRSKMEFKGNTPLGAEDPEKEFSWNETNEDVVRNLVQKLAF
jgi:copper homeostasis protein